MPTSFGVIEHELSISFTLTSIAAPAGHLMICDAPAYIPVNQVITRRHTFALHPLPRVECVIC